MKHLHLFKFDPTPAAGGGGGAPAPSTPQAPDPAAWRTGLPDGLGENPSIQKFTGPGDLAKSYVELQRLVGNKRLEAPQPTWTEKEWTQLYDSIGRPVSPDKYTLPENIKPVDGVAFDDKKLAGVKTKFHELGLTEKQGREILGLYVGSVNEAFSGEVAQQKAAQEAAMVELKGEFGGELEAKIQQGRAAVEKVGGEKLRNWLNTSGVGNNPEMIRMMIKIGDLLGSDSSRSGSAQGGAFSADQESAKSEIAALRGDKAFLDKLTAAHAPGHKEALDKWQQLHTKAFPGKITE